MSKDQPTKRPILDGYHLRTTPQYPTDLEEVPFQPLSYEEYSGVYGRLETYTSPWHPIIEIACEKTFRGLLGGERSGQGWFFETKGHYHHFTIAELTRPGIGVYLARLGAGEDDEQLWIDFFGESWFGRAQKMFPDPKAQEEIVRFALITRTMVAEMFRAGLSERTLVLAGRLGSPVEPPRMIEHDQLDFFAITDWDRGLGEFETGEAVYSLRAAYADELNALEPESEPSPEAATLRARKTRAVTSFLEARYPEGVPYTVSSGALATEVARWFREQGFDDGVSDKTVYRVRRDYNSRRRRQP